ncbi:F-box protein-like [Dorcoceras hygrometricum]|uniref:F-box protein-like n=1 Tax=Dorcoceras hygrometricum TaxID=472368 RepID=A0A2Z7BU42_9LAMI|nr:F-box protein-like [Dorcoceras hygrometricum]
MTRGRATLGPADRCVVSGKSNAIIKVVTARSECLPPSYDGLTGPDDHGSMISRLIDRGIEVRLEMNYRSIHWPS